MDWADAGVRSFICITLCGTQPNPALIAWKCEHPSSKLIWLQALTLNISSSIAIILTNKLLMSKEYGTGFQYVTTLCAAHFLTSAATVSLTSPPKKDEKDSAKPLVKLPQLETLIFVLVADASIVTLNMSLMINTVGFYQARCTDLAHFCEPAV